MQFDRDVFISYAHLDNDPEERGWITRFEKNLSSMLSKRLGREARIWRDRELKGNDAFPAEIVERIRRAAVIVSALSRRYVKSDWCTQEIHEFCTRAEQLNELYVRNTNKSRVFKVRLWPLREQQEESLHPVFRRVTGYDFFTEKGGTTLELDPELYGAEYGPPYNLKLAALAQDIEDTLEKLGVEPRANREADGSANAKTAIYLAECSKDRNDDKEVLRAELISYGYTVLPDQNLPKDDEREYIAAVDRFLTQCSLSIHLIGSTYGTVPEGSSGKSVVVLQNERAAQHSKGENHRFRRLIWVPAGTSPKQEAQQAFLRVLQEDDEAQHGADLLTGSMEELKQETHATLKKLNEPEPKTSGPRPVAKTRRRVYLLCVKKDRDAVLPLRKFLKERGLDVEIPAFEGKAADVRKAHEALLTTCDAAIVFYAAGNDSWKRTTDADLCRTNGSRPGKPRLTNVTYLAKPETKDKEEMVALGENVVDGLNAFPLEALEAFVRAVCEDGNSA